MHRHEGHLWVPLKIEPDVNVSHQIERIVDQVVKLHRAATASVVSP